MNPSDVFWIRDSGSVKLRCALSAGRAASGSFPSAAAFSRASAPPPPPPPVPHRLVLGGVGLDLRPIQGHPPQLHQPRATAQPQHLLEQPRQRPTMALADIADRAEIRLIARRQ